MRRAGQRWSTRAASSSANGAMPCAIMFVMEPLKIGVSARLLYPDPTRTFLPAKSIQYLEQSVANWIMSGEVLAFMIPEMSLGQQVSPHFPKALKVKHYVDALDGLLLQGGADMSPKSYAER